MDNSFLILFQPQITVSTSLQPAQLSKIALYEKNPSTEKTISIL